MEKLVLALHRPEPTTPLRIPWLLGKMGDSRPVAALIETIRSAEDIYLARAAVRALGETGSPEAMGFLESLSHHPVKMIRRDVLKILEGSKGVG
ncbi:MAG: HEAT repeat domain-containing protein [Deltaproteobacteria bacterium]|nr:HEAT repeat domain-containing protein [Deltaproteobacteria bacterium]